MQGPRDRGNTVDRYLCGFRALGMGRVGRSLGFQLDFLLQMLMQALRKGFFGHKCKVFCTKEWCYGFLMEIQVRGDVSVGIRVLGLTMLAVVVVEM